MVAGREIDGKRYLSRISETRKGQRAIDRGGSGDVLAQCKEFERMSYPLGINSGDSGADLERDKLREVLAKVEGGEG